VRARSRIGSSLSRRPLSEIPQAAAAADPRLRRWLAAVLATPGLTAIRNADEAWRELVEDSLTVLPLVERFSGPIVDVGSGGGAPGIPLAVVLPDREVTLLEANGRKAAFLEQAAREFPNVRVVRGRAEEQDVDRFGVAIAKALAPPAVAAEWCLPLVRPGGAAILFAGAVEADLAAVAARLAAAPPEEHPVAGSQARRLLVFRKVEATPPGFPRRPGAARKRPLA
jgi:16S rRNA (guanine527-N7)-methyltransferase